MRVWFPGPLSLLLVSCSMILGKGPPPISVYDLPERPAMKVGAMIDTAEETVYLGTAVYALPEEPPEEVELRAAFTDKAWPAFEAWLREVLARFQANRCALLAVNGETDPRCEPPK